MFDVRSIFVRIIRSQYVSISLIMNAIVAKS